MTIRNSQTYDALMLLKDAAQITASAAAQVGGVAKVIDLGAETASGAGARMDEGKVVIETTVLDHTTGDETYRATLQISNDITFATFEEGGSVLIDGTGRRELYFVNQQGNTIYRYARLYLTLAGTTPILNCSAFITKD